MALSACHLNLPSLSLTSRPSPSSPPLPISFTSNSLISSPNGLQFTSTASDSFSCASYRFSSGRYFADGEEDAAADGVGFEVAVALFNGGDYYKCHDVLEALWYSAQDPTRTLFHAILQCAVGFHHLFNRNHRGAMMELGEGLCKLRKMNFDAGPFFEFEQEISAVLDFIYQTQLELAACTDDFCLALDQSERSYQLLGGYAAGQQLYCLHADLNGAMHIVFSPERYGIGRPPRVKLPILLASEEHLKDVYDGLS